MHARLLASSRCRGILNHCFWYTNDNLQESVSCARFEKFVALVASHTEENDTRVPFMEMVWTIQCLSSLRCRVNKIYAEQSEQESVTSLDHMRMQSLNMHVKEHPLMTKQLFRLDFKQKHSFPIEEAQFKSIHVLHAITLDGNRNILLRWGFYSRKAPKTHLSESVVSSLIANQARSWI